MGLDAASLDVRDLAPFRAAIAEKVPAVVVSLALYAAYDPVTPAALSPAIASDLLRDQLGFKGVAISDDLSAGGPATGLPAAGGRRPGAGGGHRPGRRQRPRQAAQVRKAILKAARSGAIPPARLKEAIARVLSLKQRLGLLPG